MRALLLLAGVAATLALAGCTNPEYAYDVDNGACPDEGTTAPVPGDDCPLQRGEEDNTSEDETTIEDV